MSPDPTHPQSSAPGKRNRRWEKTHPPVSFRIPVHLQAVSRDIRATIAWVAERDEQGRKRQEASSADTIASILLSRSLRMLTASPARIPVRLSAYSRSGAEVVVEELWGNTPAVLGKSPRKAAAPRPRVTLSYRLPPEQFQQISRAAEERNLPKGEMLLALLSLALNDYAAGRFRFKTSPRVLLRMADYEEFGGNRKESAGA